MAHFYDCKNKKQPQLIEDIKTSAQAKKVGAHVFPSITTIIGQTIKHPFLDRIWKPKKLVEFARMEEYQDLEYQDLEQLCYGFVESPSGERVTSAEFGTAVHASAEKLLNQHKFGGQVLDSEYDEYAQPFLDWVIAQDHYIVGTEVPIADGTIKTCGTIDVILKDKETGEIFICDFKCRKSKQFYDKDLWQMAIECEMLRRKGLDYLPKCVSICIDINKKVHHHKLWSESEQLKAIQIVKHISKLYWLLNM